MRTTTSILLICAFLGAGLLQACTTVAKDESKPAARNNERPPQPLAEKGGGKGG